MPLKKPHLAIVAAEFHQDLCQEMIEAAQAEAKNQSAEVVSVVRVAGSYEIPLITNRLLVKKNIDAVIVLGYIERGETLHGEVMGHVVHTALMNLQLEYGKPVGIGIIGPGATRDQAEKRKTGAAQGAVKAAIQSYRVLKEL